MVPSTKAHTPGTTRYREIERYLRTLVEGARPGAPLPSEAELCERFSVSRMTVRQALAELTNDGLVERR
ncbi:MAG TPA: GntR family transcriptional regulator, partial [Actinomycetota bacterium]|nr:GntR family transcriptional regulator [Actinomycetota bacterium]